MTLVQWSNMLVYASMAMYSVAMLAFAAAFAAGRTSRMDPAPGSEDLRTPVAVGAATGSAQAVTTPGSGGSDDPAAAARAAARAASPMIEDGHAGGPPADRDPLPPGRRAANIGMSLTWLAFGLLVAGLIARGVWADRAPWGNMYEFSIAWVVALTGVFLAVSVRRDVRWLGLPVTMVSLIALGVAVILLYNDSPQLVPALKSYWLVIHVSAAIISGGAFTLGAVATALFLVADRAERDRRSQAVTDLDPAADLEPARSGVRARIRATNSRAAAAVAERVPDSGTLDALAYRVNAFVFPLWTFAVIAGAIWAEDAWGRYWGWDPKETWAFITWLVYAGYLHARATAGWRGRKAAMLGLLGFACFVINFFGVNLFASGLHSYSGM